MAEVGQTASTPDQHHQRCIKYTEKACQQNTTVKTLLKCLKLNGCEMSLGNNKILCEKCESNLLGGFDPIAKQIILCENNLASQNEVDRILSHELIHAYDVCMVHYDVTNPKHSACSEVRASTLSGECSFSQEWSNLLMPTKIRKQYQECVKRKAVNSICSTTRMDRQAAMKLVEQVFPWCFNDHQPFKGIPK